MFWVDVSSISHSKVIVITIINSVISITRTIMVVWYLWSAMPEINHIIVIAIINYHKLS